MAGRLVRTVCFACAVGSAGANSTGDGSSTTESGVSPEKSLTTTHTVSHQPYFGENLGMVAIGLHTQPIGFYIQNDNLETLQLQKLKTLFEPNQADKFGDFIRVTTIPNTTISIPQDDGNNIKYDLGNNKVVQNGEKPKDANILMYKGLSNNEYVLQVDGKLIHINSDKQVAVYDSKTDMNGFLKFAQTMGIDGTTRLGVVIILKELMNRRGFSMEELDEGFMDPKSDYLVFVTHTLSLKGDANIGEASPTTSSKPSSNPGNAQDVSSAHRLGAALSVAIVPFVAAQQ